MGLKCIGRKVSGIQTGSQLPSGIKAPFGPSGFSSLINHLTAAKP
jgi:hypothetical protein